MESNICLYLGVCRLVCRSRYSRVVSFHETNYINCDFVDVAGLVTGKFAYALYLNNYFNV